MLDRATASGRLIRTLPLRDRAGAGGAEGRSKASIGARRIGSVPRSGALRLAGFLVLAAGCAPEPRAEDPLWDLDHLPTYRLTFASDTWEQDLIDSLPPADEECEQRPYLQASLDFENPVTGETERFARVGVRYRGRSAIDDIGTDEWDNRAGFKIAVDELVPGVALHGRGKINLLGTEGDLSAMREFLGLRVARDAGLPAPFTNYAELYVNDRYLGTFPQTEEPDEQEYLDLHFERSDGPLFKVRGYCGGTVDFDWEGEDPERYVLDYQPKAGTDLEALSEYLVPLIACVNEEDGLDFEDCIGEHVDVDALLTAIAVDVALPDYDGLVGAGKNFLLYRDPARGRFVVYPWDKDLAFDLNDLDPSSDLFGIRPDGSSFRSRLVEGLLRAFPEQYCERALSVAELLEPEAFLAFVDQRREFLRPLMEADPFVDADEWTRHVDDVMDAVREWQPDIVDQAHACDP